MKTNIAIIAIIMLAAFTFGCSKPVNNSHSGMDHNVNTPTNSQNTNHGSTDHSTMQSSPNAAAVPYDLQFLDTMIAHHQGAIDMAKAAVAKSQHAEIKTLAANIISSQQKEIAQMKTWREQWYTDKGPAINMELPGMNDSMKGMDMKKLGSLSGNDLDLEFIDQMIPHHEGAVVMAKEVLQKSTKDEIKTLANAIINAQEAEIKQMKEWRTAWSK